MYRRGPREGRSAVGTVAQSISNGVATVRLTVHIRKFENLTQFCRSIQFIYSLNGQFDCDLKLKLPEREPQSDCFVRKYDSRAQFEELTEK
jgi:hypothetical protein